jgi:hypothetical protein
MTKDRQGFFIMQKDRALLTVCCDDKKTVALSYMQSKERLENFWPFL